VGRLHRLSHRYHQIFAQGIEIRLVPKLRREAFERLSRVVFLAVEAPVAKGLDAVPERSEKRRDHKGRGHDREGGPLAVEDDEDALQHDDEAEVEREERGRERAVDEGAVYDNVYELPSIGE
jgi:hypothetical protein